MKIALEAFSTKIKCSLVFWIFFYFIRNHCLLDSKSRQHLPKSKSRINCQSKSKKKDHINVVTYCHRKVGFSSGRLWGMFQCKISWTSIIFIFLTKPCEEFIWMNKKFCLRTDGFPSHLWTWELREVEFCYCEHYCVVLPGFDIPRYKTSKSFSHPVIPLYAMREMSQGKGQQCPFVICSPRSFIRIGDALRKASWK